VDIGDGHDPRPGLVEQPRGCRADVPETLDRHAGAIELEAGPPGSLGDDVNDALAGGVGAAGGTADRQRLPGHDAGHRVAAVHGHRVHDPGHRLRVRSDVRRGNVRFGTDDPLELRGKSPGQRLELRAAELMWVDGHAALGPAEGHVDEGALPGHPHRQRADVVEIGLGVEAEAALGRTSGHVVLNAVAGEHLDRAVVALDGKANRQLTLGHPKHGPDPGVECEVIRGGVELGQGGRKRASAVRDVRSPGIGSPGGAGRAVALHQRDSWFEA
jgi:hypothetical protein